MRYVRILSIAALLASVAPEAMASARLRVAHFSPDAPVVDVWVDGSVVLSGVPYLVSSDYLSLDAGTYRVQVTPSGTNEPVVIDAELALENGTAYTVAATGLLGSGALEPIVLVDDVVGMPGESKVRFVHTSADAPPVDVALAGGDVLFGDVAFRDATDYLSVPAGAYDLEVRVAGTMDVALSLGTVTLEGGANYNVFAVGLLGDESLGAEVLLSSDPLPASIRVAHLSPDAPAVDIWVNGSVVLEEVPFQAVSAYLDLEAGEYRIQVTPAGAVEPVVIDATLAFSGGMSYTVAATGLLGESNLRPIVLEDDRTTDPAAGKVRFVHTSPDAPAVDVALAGGDVLFGDVSFRESSEYLSIPPGTYDLEVRLAGTDTVALPLPGISVSAGVNATAFAVGLAGDGTLGALLAVDAAEVFTRGDANRDGEINISDAVSTLLYVFHVSERRICSDAADVNDDGHLDVSDPIYLLSYLFKGGEMPMPPFPEAGTDPTEDMLTCSE